MTGNDSVTGIYLSAEIRVIGFGFQSAQSLINAKGDSHSIVGIGGMDVETVRAGMVCPQVN
jgi:hypothetical protein